MPELSEIVLEDISTIELSKLSENLLCQNLMTVSFNGEDFLDRWIAHPKLNLLLEMKEDGAISMNLSKLNMSSIEIPLCTAQILKYGDKFDLNLIFEIDKLIKYNDRPVACVLRNAFQELAEKYKVRNYFGGLEPAWDEETRYFTGSNLGPLAAST